MAINSLNQGAISLSGQIPFYDSNNGADRRVSLSELAEVLQALFTQVDGVITQYEAPSATGFAVLVAPFVAGGSVFLLLTPAAAYAAGSVTLPAVATCVHGQEVIVHCTQAVAALTVSGNGASAVSGGPSSLAAGAFFRMRYDAVLRGWYRVG